MSAELKENLKRRNLKWNWDAIAADCVAKPKQIPRLLSYCTDNEVIVQQNAGAVLGKIIDLDQAETGAQRSAMYFGVQGLMTKWVFAASGAILINRDSREQGGVLMFC